MIHTENIFYDEVENCLAETFDTQNWGFACNIMLRADRCYDVCAYLSIVFR